MVLVAPCEKFQWLCKYVTRHYLKVTFWIMYLVSVFIFSVSVPLRVTHVEDPTHAEEYRCESSDDAETTNYSWLR